VVRRLSKGERYNWRVCPGSWNLKEKEGNNKIIA